MFGLLACSSQDPAGGAIAASAENATTQLVRPAPVPAEPGTPEIASRSASATPDKATEDANDPLGSFELTYYWMARQGRGKREVSLYDRYCKRLTKVSKSFVKKLEREGTGHLRDGRTLNVWGECKCPRSPCYFVPDRKKRWGVGVAKRALSPFRSVAVDPEAVPIGTILYIPELDGLTVPGRAPWGGFVHDGCVVADDRGGKVVGQQLDLFMAKKTHYRSFYRRHRLSNVTVFDGRNRCARDDGANIVPVNRNSI